MSALAELAADAETIRGIGDNNPPEPTAWDGVRTHLDDLLTEARNWADGVAVENQAQADEISRLIEDLRLGGNAADDKRVEEKAPLDKKIEEIQERYNAYIGGLKSKVKNPGKVVIAIEALKATLKPYLERLQAEKDAETKRLADEAAAAAAKALEAARAAAPEDLAAREEAEELIATAQQLTAAFGRASKDRAHASGGSRAMGLRKTFTPVLADANAALRHYIVERPDEVKACLLQLAVVDVREGKRQIPGFDVVEGTAL